MVAHVDEHLVQADPILNLLEGWIDFNQPTLKRSGAHVIKRLARV
jgi:hypothetical protein